MSFKRTVKRFAHIAGYTFTTFTEDGENILTCGKNDGDVRIWKEINDDDPSSFCVGEAAINCVQVDEEKLMVANDKNIVQYHTFPQGDRAGVAFRFSSLVTTLKANKTYLAAGSEDGLIKFVKRTSVDEMFELKGHKGPILHIEMNLQMNLLASSSGDGSIRVWDMKSQNCLKTISGLPTSSNLDSAKVFSSPSFNPKGSLLAYPSGKYIRVLDTATWEEKHKLENDDIENDYAQCSISPCGMFLAAGSIKGEISLWNMMSKSCLKGPYQGEDIYAISSMSWNPANNGELAFCDLDGQLSTVVINDGKNEDFFNGEAEDVGMDNANDDPYDGIDFQDDGDEDNENCISLERLKNDTIKGNDIDDDDENDDLKSVISKSVISEHLPIRKFQLQSAFQPGSTPSSLEHRFMVWNHIGQVLCHSGSENSIITEFHDVTLHPSLHILNNLNHDMASLSKSCLALATKDSTSRLVCITFSGAGSKEWSVAMADCEEIQAVAAGENFVAVATDLNYVRFFTTMGTQREVIAVPGPVVAMSGYENKLLIAYHTSNTCNKFNMLFITVVGMKMVSKTLEVPTQAESKLQWIGFSDVGSPTIYDSTGKLCCYMIKRGLWLPICDMSEHTFSASDKFFIVSVTESQQKIRAVNCRGTTYPLTNPRPFITEINYTMPLCNIESEKSKLEEAMVRASVFGAETSEKMIIENGLKLFSSALNSEFESRAFELIELLGERKLIELAAKYATQKGRIQMSNKINKLLSNFEDLQREQRDALEENSVLEISDIHTSHIVPIMQEAASTPIIAPKIMSTHRSNPFKKVSNISKSLSTPPSALGHLSKKVIGMNSTSNKDSDDENMPKNNNSSVISNKSLSADTPRPGNFGQWFMANKEVLMIEFPGVTDVELMQQGKARYKEVTLKNNSQTGDLNESEQMKASNSKRKLNVSDAEGGISKLSKFGFDND